MEDNIEANVSQIMDLITNSTLGSNMTQCPVPAQRGWTRKIAVMSTIAILTILGNAAIIIAIMRRNCKMSRMYYLILHLSLADLLTALLTLLPEVAWTATLPQFYGGIVTCKLLKVLQLLGPYLSSYILCVTAVDRYQAICKPLQSFYWSPYKSKVMLLVAWLISLVCCLPQSFIFIIKDRSYCQNTMTYQTCSHDFSGLISISGYVIFFSVANFLLPLVVLLYCYSCICSVIWKNFKRKTSSFRPGDDKTGENGELARGRNAFRPGDDKTGENGELAGGRNAFRPGDDKTGENVELAAERNVWQVLTTCCCRSKPQQNSLELHNRQLPQVELPGMIPPKKCRIIIRTEEMNGSTRSSQSNQRPSRSIPNLQQRTPISSQSNRRLNKSSPNIQPRTLRTHSIRGITRAKMKTVKLTVTVMMCYIVCSFPFIMGQIVSVFGTREMQKFFGTKMEFLYWLLTLNSVTNPWIYFLFNENLVESLKSCICGGGSRSPTLARKNTTIAIQKTTSRLSSRYSLTTTTELTTNFSNKSSPNGFTIHGRRKLNIID